MRPFLFFFIMFLCSLNANSSICSSIASGEWDDGSTWNCGRQPTNGDSVLINSSHVVSVESNINTPSDILFIIVNGTLEFNVGKITIASGSFVEINIGGLIINSGSGGGSSSMITIGGTSVWKASDGNVSGYKKFENAPLYFQDEKLFESESMKGDFLEIKQIDGRLSINSSSSCFVEIYSINGSILFRGTIGGEVEILIKGKNQILICKTIQNNQVKYFKFLFF